jgi:hypothetical protein
MNISTKTNNMSTTLLNNCGQLLRRNFFKIFIATIALLMGGKSWGQQTQPAKINLPATRKFTKTLRLICLMLLLWGQSNAQLVWSGAASCAGGSGGTWLTVNQWCNGSVSATATPQSTQIAQFGSLGTATSIGMNMNGITAANKTVGAIEITSANTVARTITNSSTSTAGESR